MDQMATEEETPSSPDVQSSDINLSQFTELLSTQAQKKHQFSLASSPSNPLYTIQYHFHYSSKPDIEIHCSPSTTSPIAGIVRLQTTGIRLGIGDPNHIYQPDSTDIPNRMIWETMNRCTKWNYNHYSFEYERAGKGREVYTWCRTKSFWTHMMEMKLRVGGKGDKGGEVLAVWKRSEKINMKRGALWVRGWGEDGKWDLVVLMGIVAIVEAEVRRG